MSNKLGVQVERSSIAVANSSNGSSSNSRNSSNNWGSSSISNSLGSKMISTGSSNCWIIKRNNSSIGMSNELSVQVKRTSIAIGTSISWGIPSITKAGVPSSVSTNIAKTCSISGITRTIPSCTISWSICIARWFSCNVFSIHGQQGGQHGQQPQQAHQQGQQLH